jgi:hypothetical protein
MVKTSGAEPVRRTVSRVLKRLDLVQDLLVYRGRVPHCALFVFVLFRSRRIAVVGMAMGRVDCAFSSRAACPYGGRWSAFLNRNGP